MKIVEDEEKSKLPFGYTHRKAYYPDGPEIKGDGIDDLDDIDLTSKDVWIEIDIIERWDESWLDNLEVIKSVAKSILESVVVASRIPESDTDYSKKIWSGIRVHYYEDVDTIEYVDSLYRLSTSEA